MERRTFLKLVTASPLAMLPVVPQAGTACTYGTGLYGEDIYNGSCVPTTITLNNGGASPTVLLPYAAGAGILALLSWQIQRLQRAEHSENS